MTTYYKATAMNGKSWRTSDTGERIDYAAALVSGEVIRHPSKRKVRNDATTYLSVSVEPADCTGMQWPCRLFRVETVGRVMGSDRYPNKRAVSALRVVEELPAHLTLGPNGEQVAAFIEACKTLTVDDWRMVASAWAAARTAADAARAAAWAAAWDAARDAAGAAAGDAAWAAAWAAAWDAAGAAARAAAGDAAGAITVRDLITPAQYDTLTQPFVDAGLAHVVDR